MTYNLSFDICGIVILLVLLFILHKFYVVNTKSSKYFRMFLLVSICSGVLDIVTAYTIVYSSHIPAPFNLILNTIYMYFGSYVTYNGVRYIFSTVRFKTKIYPTINRILFLVYCGLLFINLFSGIIFDFKGRVYHHGPIYILSFFESFIIMFYCMGVLFYHHKLFTKKQILLFSSFGFSPVIFVSFQLINPNNLMTVFSSSVSALLMMFAVETPDFVELEYLRKNLEKKVEERTHDLKKANKELEKKNHQAKQDMDLAAHLQQVLYTHNFDYLGWDIAVKFEPLFGISGDLYDFYVLEGKLCGFGLFDVSGHGISSGLVTVLAKDAILHEFRTTLQLKLSDAMVRINNSVIRVKGDIENYLTGVICRIDKDNSSKIEISNAGAPYPIFKAKNKKNSVLLMPDSKKPQYGMIGVEGLDVCFQTIKKNMKIGDVLVLYTDGIIEAENESGIQFGKERLQSIVDSVPADSSAQEILDAISDDFKKFIGDTEIDDDISVMVIKRIEESSGDDLMEELELIED